MDVLSSNPVLDLLISSASLNAWLAHRTHISFAELPKNALECLGSDSYPMCLDTIQLKILPAPYNPTSPSISFKNPGATPSQRNETPTD